MTIKVANRKPHCLLDSLYLFSMMPDVCGSLPLSSVQQTMDCTLSKSLQLWTILMCPVTTYHEHHPDAVKADKHITTNVAPATPTHPPATQAVQPAPCVAPATPQASCNTLHTQVKHTHCAHAFPCTVSNTDAKWHRTCCPLPFCLEQ